MDQDRALRDHLTRLLTGAEAHVTTEQVLRDWPAADRGHSPPGFGHSPWQLLEHLRICQWDILEFARNAEYVSPEFPAGYWPNGPAPASEADWERSCSGFRRDLQALVGTVSDSEIDLYQPFAHGTGQTMLRQALLVADHNAYHTGQLAGIRKAQSGWRPEPTWTIE